MEAGPEPHPYLYRDGIRLLTGADQSGASPEASNDLLRAPNGRAIIGDHRNDENRIVSQLQLGMIKFHNNICDTLHTANPSLEDAELFEEARKFVTWHYQWAVVFDFLVAMCGRPVVNDILTNGRRILLTSKKLTSQLSSLLLHIVSVTRWSLRKSKFSRVNHLMSSSAQNLVVVSLQSAQLMQ